MREKVLFPKLRYLRRPFAIVFRFADVCSHHYPAVVWRRACNRGNRPIWTIGAFLRIRMSPCIQLSLTKVPGFLRCIDSASAYAAGLSAVSSMIFFMCKGLVLTKCSAMETYRSKGHSFISFAFRPSLICTEMLPGGSGNPT